MSDDPFSHRSRLAAILGSLDWARRVTEPTGELEKWIGTSRTLQELVPRKNAIENLMEQTNSLRELTSYSGLAHQLSAPTSVAQQLDEGLKNISGFSGKENFFNKAFDSINVAQNFLKSGNSFGTLSGGSNIAKELIGRRNIAEQFAERVNGNRFVTDAGRLADQLSGASNMTGTLAEQAKKFSISGTSGVSGLNFEMSIFQKFLEVEKNLGAVLGGVSEGLLKNKFHENEFREIAKQVEKHPFYDIFENNAVSSLSSFPPEFAVTTASYIEHAQSILQASFDDEAEMDEKYLYHAINGLINYVIGSLQSARTNIEIKTLLDVVFFRLLPLILAVYSLYSGEELSENLSEYQEAVRHQHELEMNEINKIDRKIEEIERVCMERSECLQGVQFYRVKRIVPVTDKKKYTGNRVAWLFPGQTAELVERSGKWIRVISYDFSSEENVTGWVLKKYLRKDE